jgi:hypothetical protein
MCCGLIYSEMGEALSQGLINETDIRKSYFRIMRERILLGQFDPPDYVTCRKDFNNFDCLYVCLFVVFVCLCVCVFVFV